MNEQNMHIYLNMTKEAVEKMKETVDLLIRSGSEEGYIKLYQIFKDRDVMRLINRDNDLFIVAKIVTLWFKEYEADRADHIFSNVNTMEDVIELYKNITFSFYRLEQNLPLEYQDEAVQYIVDMNISPITLWGMAEDKIVDDAVFYKALSEGFYRNGYRARGNEIEEYRKRKEKENTYE